MKTINWLGRIALALASICTILAFIFLVSDLLSIKSMRDSIALGAAVSSEREVYLVSAARIVVKEQNRTYIRDFPGRDIEAIAISPNGNTLLMQIRETGGFSLLLALNFQEGNIWELPYSGGHPTFLDDQRILVDHAGKIFLINLRDPNTQTFLARGSRPAGIIGQNAFVFQKPDATLALYKIDILEETPIHLDIHAVAPAVSPDGKFIAFLNGDANYCDTYCPGTLWVYSFESKQARQIQSTGIQHLPVWKNNYTVHATSSHALWISNTKTRDKIMYSFSIYDKAQPVPVSIVPK
ncbi:PD40 domain-containing protein [Candidatus Gottesmanbacteria bacterium]|nr:PD40 domain-containing protein [Candidatus Gottesmanbacteria bacterium]